MLREEIFSQRTNDTMSIADIRNYGAVGDGVTDCTRSIQDAINACLPGDVVLISEGLFLGHKGMIFMESAYKEAEPKPEMIPPEVSDVRLSDLRIDSPDRTAVYIHGFADRPFREIVFSNVSYTCKGPNDIQNAEVIFELIPQERRSNCVIGNGKADSAPLGEE